MKGMSGTTRDRYRFISVVELQKSLPGVCHRKIKDPEFEQWGMDE